MKTFAVLFVLLISAAAVLSESDSFEEEEEAMELATKLEENLVRIKAIECRYDTLIPRQFKQNCVDFLKDFQLAYKNCFCHKIEVSVHSTL